MGTIHLHIWPLDEETWNDGPEECIDFEHVDTYPDPEGYDQYKGTLKDGRHLELRVPLS